MANKVKCCCPNCGTISDANLDEVTEDNWLNCSKPEGFEWVLPSGKLKPVVGEPIYVSAFGEHMSRKAYIDKYNIDPEIAYTNMRATIGSPKPKPLGMAAKK